MSAGAASMFWRVLGPLRVTLDGAEREIGGRLSRRLLTALLVEPGSSVRDARLVGLVWGQDGPEDPNALRVVVSRARAALGAEGRDRLRRGRSGYLLDVSLDHTDLGRFSELVTAGLDRLAEGDPHAGLERLTSALSLWRGEPWQDLDDALVVAGARNGLVELREVALEERQAARLAIGETAGAVAELGDLAVAAPFRERRWELFATGLYRAGRQAQALAELRRVRKLLADELGVEPGPALRGVERRILNQDPGLLSEPAPRPRPNAAPSAPPVAKVAGVSRPLTSFVARGDELGLLESLRRTARLVTLVGPAGVGKTRLAVEYAATLAEPVWLARLSDAPSADAVAAITAAAVGVRQIGGNTTALIARTVADRDALLVLDNCEHVVEAAAALILRLLVECPRLRVLTTSRRPLDIDGEHPVRVAPLPVLDPGGGDGAAVRLLLDRVRAGRPGWAPEAADRDAARRICALLDGLPLAIELAAARERAFGLAALADHLRDGLHVLGTTPRGSLTPHASLTAAIAWSVDQLDPADRSLLVRLWPFEGGFASAAAEAIVADTPAGFEGEQRRPAVLAALASLVDRSVVVSDIAEGSARYRLLETIRGYCRTADPEPAATRAAHAAWVRTFVIEQTARLTAPAAVHDFRPLRAELPNIRAAVEHDLAREPVWALRVGAAMEFAWASLGVQTEGLRLIRAALHACPDAPALDRAQGLLALSIGALHAGDPAQTVRRADAALDLLDDPDDDAHAVTRLKALTYRGGGASELGDKRLLRETLERFATESSGRVVPDWIRSNALLNQAGLEILEGRWASAETTLGAARELAARCGFIWAAGTADLMLARGLIGRPASSPEDVWRATAALHRAMAVFDSQDNLIDALGALHTGAHALLRLGHTATAITLHAAVAEHTGRLGTTLDRLAHLAGRRAEHALATARLGLHTVELESTGRGLDWPAAVGLFRDATTR